MTVEDGTNFKVTKAFACSELQTCSVIVVSLETVTDKISKDSSISHEKKTDKRFFVFVSNSILYLGVM